MLVKPDLYTKEKAMRAKLRCSKEAISHYAENINDIHRQSQTRKWNDQSKSDDNSRSGAQEIA